MLFVVIIIEGTIFGFYSPVINVHTNTGLIYPLAGTKQGDLTYKNHIFQRNKFNWEWVTRLVVTY